MRQQQQESPCNQHGGKLPVRRWGGGYGRTSVQRPGMLMLNLSVLPLPRPWQPLPRDTREVNIGHAEQTDELHPTIAVTTKRGDIASCVTTTSSLRRLPPPATGSPRIQLRSMHPSNWESGEAGPKNAAHTKHPATVHRVLPFKGYCRTWNCFGLRSKNIKYSDIL